MYDVSGVLMKTGYKTTIGYANVCSRMQDHRIKFLFLSQVLILKFEDFEQNLKKDQLESQHSNQKRNFVQKHVKN